MNSLLAPKSAERHERAMGGLDKFLLHKRVSMAEFVIHRDPKFAMYLTEAHAFTHGQ